MSGHPNRSEVGLSYPERERETKRNEKVKENEKDRTGKLPSWTSQNAMLNEELVTFLLLEGTSMQHVERSNVYEAAGGVDVIFQGKGAVRNMLDWVLFNIENDDMCFDGKVSRKINKEEASWKM
jgi:hypothetical protein